jgi:ubiquinone biosynthesis monooxygenase Coq7
MPSIATSGRSLSRLDHWLGAADSALRTLAAPTPGAASKPTHIHS